MADRQTMDVSIPGAQEDFVRAQVGSGRYRTASEVVREALRLLEEREHARLVEKSLYEGLSADEERLLPPGLLGEAREHIRSLVGEGLRDRDTGRISDGPQAMDRLRDQLTARRSG
jgi:putative addiction module CopG family antidote